MVRRGCWWFASFHPRSGCLRINFIGALGGDHIGQLLDDVDIGSFQVGLQQGIEAVFSGRTYLGGAGSGGFFEEVLALCCVELGFFLKNRFEADI